MSPKHITDPFGSLNERIGELLGRAQKGGVVWGIADGAWRPPTDVVEYENEVFVRVEIAGMRQEDIQTRFVGEDTLVVRGERRCPPFESAAACCHQMEISYGHFERRIVFRGPIDADRIEAHYTDGFLTIRLPKLERSARKVVVVIR